MGMMRLGLGLGLWMWLGQGALLVHGHQFHGGLLNCQGVRFIHILLGGISIQQGIGSSLETSLGTRATPIRNGLSISARPSDDGIGNSITYASALRRRATTDLVPARRAGEPLLALLVAQRCLGAGAAAHLATGQVVVSAERAAGAQEAFAGVALE
jgi:hypothetical protein